MPRSKSNVGAGGRGDVLAALHSYHRTLVDQFNGVKAELDAVENTIHQLGAAPPAARRGPGRPPGSTAAASGGGGGKGRGRHGPRAGSLKEFVVRALSGKGVMAVKDITSGVLSLGYKTKNKTLAKSVGIALTELKDQVQRVGRGKFKLR
ncbi:MAG: hypothetical protein JNG88_01295 [Phycisphaerales bacterium]|nr:hypothetical protein [Phycisphaerales bacterium]